MISSFVTFAEAVVVAETTGVVGFGDAGAGGKAMATITVAPIIRSSNSDVAINADCVRNVALRRLSGSAYDYFEPTL